MKAITPFTLRYDRRWPVECCVTGAAQKWYRVYLDGIEYGRLVVWEHGGSYLCTPDGYDTIRDNSSMRDFRSIGECLFGSKSHMHTTQEAMF